MNENSHHTDASHDRGVRRRRRTAGGAGERVRHGRRGRRRQRASATAGFAPIGPGTIPYLSHGIGVDESLFQGRPRAVARARSRYLSHGIGVDETLFAGAASARTDWRLAR